MLRLKSKGVTMMRTNESLKINNNCAIKVGVGKLTIEKTIIPPNEFWATKVDTRRNDNPARKLTLDEKERSRGNARITHSPP